MTDIMYKKNAFERELPEEFDTSAYEKCSKRLQRVWHFDDKHVVSMLRSILKNWGERTEVNEK
jgi:hypothetical protein